MLQRVKHANLKSWQNLMNKTPWHFSLKTVNMSGGNKWYNCTSQGNKNKVCSHSGKNEICLLLLLFKRKSAHEIQSVRASDNCTTSIRISFSLVIIMKCTWSKVKFRDWKGIYKQTRIGIILDTAGHWLLTSTHA